MKYRNLRIAWTIALVLLCQPLLLLWAVSYSELNGLTMPVGRSRGMIVSIVTGRLAIGIPDDTFAWRWWRSDLSDDHPPHDAMPQSTWALDSHQLVAPMWLPVMLAGALAAAPWISWPTRSRRARPGNSFSSVHS